MDLPLKLEARVLKVSKPRVNRDRISIRFGQIKTEFVVDKKLVWNGRNQTFWGELPKELVGHNIRIYSDGDRQVVHDVEADVWYKSGSRR